MEARKRSLKTRTVNIYSHAFNSKNVPLKCREYGRRGSSSANSRRLIATRIAEHGTKCNPSGEPEDHGDNLYGENAEFVCNGWEAAGSNNQVGESDDRPDGAEKHVVGLSRGPSAIVPPRPVIHYC